MNRDPKQEQPPDFGEEVRIDPSSYRRSPRYRGFIIAGAVVGVITAWVASRFGTPQPNLDANGMAWLLTAMLAPLGMFVGAIVALIIDRRSQRRMEKVRSASSAAVQTTQTSSMLTGMESETGVDRVVDVESDGDETARDVVRDSQ